MRVLEFWFHCGFSLLIYVTLFYTRDLAGLVETTYLTECCDTISIQP